MTEKNKSEKMTNASKPVPMKLFAAWEVDRTPSNCIPRVCTLRVTRLRLAGARGEAVSLAARMHASKRTLRSNDIALPPAPAPLDVDLDLTFTLQYPHFVKRDGNRLQIMLQRRKKYKNRTILGYKTLAEGVIRMDQVLQRSMDMELELGSAASATGKAGGPPAPLARLTIAGLASTPVDHDTKNNNNLITERGYSDEEEEAEFSSVEENDEALSYNRRAYAKMAYLDGAGYEGGTGKDRDSDSEPDTRHAKRKGSRGKLAQRNLKQKFAALLRRFRVPEEMAARDAARASTEDGDREIDELFQELESLSCGEGEDSGPDQMDTISIGSTPKPSLRPFFSSSRSLAAGAASSQAHDGLNRHYNPGALRLPRASVATQHADASAQTIRPRNTAPHAISPESDSTRLSGADYLVCERVVSEANSETEQETAVTKSVTSDLALTYAAVSSSPPKEKDEKKSRLFRSATSTPASNLQGRKKNSLSIIATADLRPNSSYEICTQSPTNLEPRRSILEQLSRVLPADEGAVPEGLVLLQAGGGAGAWGAAVLLPALNLLALPTLSLQHLADVRAPMNAIFNRMSKQNNSGGRIPMCVRLVLCGGDALVAAALRAYCELWPRRPPDAVQNIRFYIVPVGSNGVARQLATMEPGYAAMFGDSWSMLYDRNTDSSSQDISDISSRLARYVNSLGPTLQMPIAEAMVAYRERSCDEDSNQTFVPFITDVKIGWQEWCATQLASLELEEAGGASVGSASPPARPSPPATPALAPDVPPAEPLELQLDYWQVQRATDAGRADAAGGGKTRATSGGSTPACDAPLPPAAKGTLKCAFRSLHVSRAPHDPSNLFVITYVTKEKKQKIMRLGKKKEKDKDTDSGKTQAVDSVARLICSTKASHNVPLRVYIDGTEWNGVKFFQLSTQWQTHVKHFPIALMGAPLAPQET